MYKYKLSILQFKVSGFPIQPTFQLTFHEQTNAIRKTIIIQPSDYEGNNTSLPSHLIFKGPNQMSLKVQIAEIVSNGQQNLFASGFIPIGINHQDRSMKWILKSTKQKNSGASILTKLTILQQRSSSKANQKILTLKQSSINLNPAIEASYDLQQDSKDQVAQNQIFDISDNQERQPITQEKKNSNPSRIQKSLIQYINFRNGKHNTALNSVQKNKISDKVGGRINHRRKYTYDQEYEKIEKIKNKNEQYIKYFKRPRIINHKTQPMKYINNIRLLKLQTNSSYSSNLLQQKVIPDLLTLLNFNTFEPILELNFRKCQEKQIDIELQLPLIYQFVKIEVIIYNSQDLIGILGLQLGNNMSIVMKRKTNTKKKFTDEYKLILDVTQNPKTKLTHLNIDNQNKSFQQREQNNHYLSFNSLNEKVQSIKKQIYVQPWDILHFTRLKNQAIIKQNQSKNASKLMLCRRRVKTNEINNSNLDKYTTIPRNKFNKIQTKTIEDIVVGFDKNTSPQHNNQKILQKSYRNKKKHYPKSSRSKKKIQTKSIQNNRNSILPRNSSKYRQQNQYYRFNKNLGSNYKNGRKLHIKNINFNFNQKYRQQVSDQEKFLLQIKVGQNSIYKTKLTFNVEDKYYIWILKQCIFFNVYPMELLQCEVIGILGNITKSYGFMIVLISQLYLLSRNRIYNGEVIKNRKKLGQLGLSFEINDSHQKSKNYTTKDTLKLAQILRKQNQKFILNKVNKYREFSIDN